MKRKILAICACSAILAGVLCMSGCVDQVADGMEQAGSFLRENKEPIESGLNELQDTLIDVGDAINKHIKEDNTIQTTPVTTSVTPETTSTAYMLQDPSIQIEYGKGMMY